MTFMTDYMAELIMASADTAKKKRPGRPIAIDDGTLVNARDQMISLLETTWENVGERLPWIKKPEELLRLLQIWKNDNRQNHHYLTQLLVRTSSVPCTAPDLARLRRQMREANIAQRNAWDQHESCREALDKANHAFSDELLEPDKAKVQDQIARRAEKFAQAESDYLAATARQQTAQESLSDAEACFARSEFVRFIRSNRYRLKPVNIANAIAGLPYISWRQSALRCKKHPPVGSDGLSMQIFNVIRRIADSCPRRSELISHAQQWLKDKRTRKSLGAEKLREKFYYLRWAIKAVLEVEKRVTSRELPFAITREYWNRVNRPSNVDLLFEEEERIVN